MALFLWVCLGGAAGSGARYLVSTWIRDATGARFPFGTLAVNVVGSFLLAAILAIGASSDLIPERWRVASTAGVLGGFTTYSTFNQETLEFVRQGAFVLAAANVLGTVVACFASGVLGLAVGRWFAAS